MSRARLFELLTTCIVAWRHDPASLGSFQNTPMEQAIRDCIGKATT